VWSPRDGIKGDARWESTPSGRGGVEEHQGDIENMGSCGKKKGSNEPQGKNLGNPGKTKEKQTLPARMVVKVGGETLWGEGGEETLKKRGHCT